MNTRLRACLLKSSLLFSPSCSFGFLFSFTLDNLEDLSDDYSIYRFGFYTVSEILAIELVRIGLVEKLPKRTLSSLAAAAYPNPHFE